MNDEKFDINRFFQLMSKSDAARRPAGGAAGLLAAVRSLFAGRKPRRTTATTDGGAGNAALRRPSAYRGGWAGASLAMDAALDDASYAPPAKASIPDGTTPGGRAGGEASLAQPASPGAAPARGSHPPQPSEYWEASPLRQADTPSEAAPPASPDAPTAAATHPSSPTGDGTDLPPAPSPASGDSISHPRGWEMPAAPTELERRSVGAGGPWEAEPDPLAPPRRRFAEIPEFYTNPAGFSRNSADFYKSAPAAEVSVSRPAERPAAIRDDPHRAAQQVARVIERDARRY